MKEDQVNPEPLVIDPQPTLTADEGKVIPQFQQEGLKMAN